MDSNLPKCLICGELYPKKGLSFFKFPTNTARFNTWIKAVTPILKPLKIPIADVKENGRICAKHFTDKDFINLKRNSLVQDACPFLDLMPTALNSEVTYIFQKDGNQEVLCNEKLQESDTFVCGRCKMHFKSLSEFFDHKQMTCDVKMNELFMGSTVDNGVLLESTNLPVEDGSLVNANQKLVLENCTVHTVNENCETVEFINGVTTDVTEIISLVVSDNRLLIANTPVDLSMLSGQLMLMNGNAGLDATLGTTDVGQDGIVLTDLSRTVFENPLVLAAEAVEINNEVASILPSNDNNNTSHSDMQINETSNGNTFHEAENCRTDKLIELKNSDLILQNNKLVKNLPQPVKSEKRKKKLTCSHCNKVFDRPFNLQQHERVHTKEHPFQCIICGRAFSQKANVRKHMIRHKVWPHAKQTLKINIDHDQKLIIDQDSLDCMNYSCQYCSLSFKSYSLHKKHLAVHCNLKVYRCIQKGCDLTFCDLDDFLSHSENHQQVEFQCHVCLKVFNDLGSLGAHQYDHDTSEGERKDTFDVKLKCEVCLAQFKTIESLKNHQAVDSHKYECPQCKSVFNCERFLRRHLATHLNPLKLKFQCLKCKKCFRTQKYLNNHSYIHSKVKPFNCEHCDKQFASKYRMKRHSAIHLNQFLECPFKSYLGCDKKFYRKDKLRDHAATHRSFKILPCGSCSNTFTSLLKLQQHVKKDHKTDASKQVLRCSKCSQMFRKQKQLVQHCCTVGERKFKSRVRVKSPGEKKEKNVENPEMVSTIEIIMVPFAASGDAQSQDG